MTISPLDGSASGFVNHGDHFTITISTTRPNDVLLLYVRTESNPTGRTVTGVASPSLTMALRTPAHTDAPAGGAASDHGEGSYWWVHAPSILTGEVFIVSLDASTPTAAGFMVAITGALSPSAPFDANGSLPALNAHNASAAVSVATGSISTDSPHTVLLALGGDDNAAVVASLGINSGVGAWTKVGSINGNGAPEANFASASIGYLTQCGGTVSGVVATWGPSFQAYQSASWGDAIVVGADICVIASAVPQVWINE